MSDIDWLAVHHVCTGQRMGQLTNDEKKAIVRRLAPRMLQADEWYCDGNKVNVWEVARRLNTTERTVQRIKASLPPADEDVCPVCQEQIWVVDGVVEEHPDTLITECPMSGRPHPGYTRLRGLAALRPDLYQWLEVS